jgi:hypothetical protein
MRESIMHDLPLVGDCGSILHYVHDSSCQKDAQKKQVMGCTTYYN